MEHNKCAKLGLSSILNSLTACGGKIRVCLMVKSALGDPEADELNPEGQSGDVYFLSLSLMMVCSK